jgi:acyl-CoA synthetase (AMP-forming)/AMP-acid ligase II
MASESLREGLGGTASRVGGRVADGFWALGVLARAGIVRPLRPDKAAQIGQRFVRWGASPALGSAASAIGEPDEVALIDEAGSLTFSQLHRRSNALARALAQQGVDPGDGVAIMCRNHRYFILATLACSKLGASALYLNTAFAGPQLADVMERERPSALIYDEEFAELLHAEQQDAHRMVAWSEGSPGDPTLDELIDSTGDDSDLEPPEEPGRYVILTSGTTGTPKGAQRESPSGLMPLAALFSKIPHQRREKIVISAPLFHSWGFLHFVIGLPLAATLILRRRFDPEDALRALAEHRAEVLAVVPVMMQRILELPPEARSRHDVSSLRITTASGSALPGELSARWMDEFGDNLYQLYGSTEVAWATIATPEEMREAPGTAGTPPRGTTVRIVDERGTDVPTGETGRIFVGNDALAFEGYTGGDDKEHLGELLSSGDVGHFDERGHLFVDGRDDEMIVSGGENVFPREVEDLLSDHEAVAEAAAVGIEDEQFGQRLRAFVVTREGREVSEEELKSYVKENLARYKVPREIVFLDQLPRNATGKVLKRELAEHQLAD